MIIDCHAHLDERALSLEDQIQKMDEQGIQKTALIARITETLEPDKSEFLLYSVLPSNAITDKFDY